MLEPAGAGVWVIPTLDAKRPALYVNSAYCDLFSQPSKRSPAIGSHAHARVTGGMCPD